MAITIKHTRVGYPVNKKDWTPEHDINQSAVEEYWKNNNYTKAMGRMAKRTPARRGKGGKKTN